MALPLMPVDPDAGIPDLVRRLADDSKRLVGDEVRLAKLEMRESLHQTGHGAMFLGVAFAMTIVAVVMLTLFVATLVGRVVSGHMWVGALAIGLVELLVGFWLVKHGLSLGKTSVSEIKR